MAGARIAKEQLDPMVIAPVSTRTFVATPGEPSTDVTENDSFVAVDATAVSATARLPDASLVGGRTFKVGKVDDQGNLLTVNCLVPGQMINGSSSTQLAGIGVVTVTSDGANYYKG